MDMTMSQPQTAVRAPISSRVTQIRTAAGIEVWLVEDHARPLLCVRFGFRRAVKAVRSEIPGAGAVMAKSLIEGAGDMNDEAFRLALSEAAIDLGVALQFDHLHGSMQCLSRDAPRAFQLLTLALTKPRFAEDVIERQRTMLRAALSNQMRNPVRLALDHFMSTAFGTHSYGIGNDEVHDRLATLKRSDVIDAHEQMLTRANAVVVVVGNIGVATLTRAIEDAFGLLPSGTAVEVAPCTMQNLGQTVTRHMATPQTGLIFGRPCISADDPDFAAAQVVARAFGGGDFGSRLFTELRENRNLCYSIAMQIEMAAGLCCLIGLTSTPNDKAGEARDAIQSEIARLLDRGLTAEEIDDARTYLVGADKMARVSSSALAGALFSLQLRKKTPDWIHTAIANIDKVTPEDVARVIPRMFGDGALLFSIADPTP